LEAVKRQVKAQRDDEKDGRGCVCVQSLFTSLKREAVWRARIAECLKRTDKSLIDAIRGGLAAGGVSRKHTSR
jgi:hypothetical protein